MFKRFAVFLISFFLSVSLQAQEDGPLTWIQIIQKGQKDTNLINAHYYLAKSLVIKNSDSAILLLDQSLQLLPKIPYSKKERALRRLEHADVKGRAYYFKGDYNKAVQEFDNSIRIAEEANIDPIKKANLLENSSIILNEMGNYPEALNRLLSARKVYEERKDSARLFTSAINIGIVYKYMEDYDKALEYYFFGYKIKDKADDDDMRGAVCNNIGTVYLQLKDPENGLKYFRESYNWRKNLEQHASQVASSMANMGNAYREMKEYDSALYWHNESLKLREAENDKLGLIVVHNNLGNDYFEVGKLELARKHTLRSTQICRDIGHPEFLKDNLFLLHQIEERSGNAKKALEYFKEYFSLKDSLSNDERNKDIARSEARFEYQKKQVADSVNNAKMRELDQATIREQNANLEKRKWQNIFLFGGLSILIIFSLILYSRFKITHKQKGIIEAQNSSLEEKQKEILDSINYAKRIQYTLLAHEELLKENLPEHFVLFQPKDIVSGDFYWASKKGNDFYLAVCDSTGHGVPGAFMSLLNISFLNEAINEKNIPEPEKILDHVRTQLIRNLSRDGAKDGMDATLIKFPVAGDHMYFASANNRPILIRAGEIRELPCDKLPVGPSEKKDNFSGYFTELKKGDLLYFFTDGFADQFGGPKGKKYKYKPLHQLLLSVSSLSLEQQKEKIYWEFTSWKGELEQVDDVCVIGVRI